MEWHVRDFVAQPVQYLLSSRGGAIEQDKGKLVAAKARNHIPRPHRLFQFAAHAGQQHVADVMTRGVVHEFEAIKIDEAQAVFGASVAGDIERRSERHTSEIQSLMRISYADFCLKKK